MLITIRRRTIPMLLASLFAAGCASNNTATADVAPNAEAVEPADRDPRRCAVYLVRHAEKEKGRDPRLTPAGQERAEELAGIMSGIGIDAIYSTNYRRTLDTAAPLAAALGLDIAIYDPRNLQAVADELRTAEGRILVVGHSNTTPQLTAILAPNAEVRSMSEDEYDHLFQVTWWPAREGKGESQEPRLGRLRYGRKSEQ
ncbi:MAG: histidine phosphatase family protein [Planctomycetota bacterium]